VLSIAAAGSLFATLIFDDAFFQAGPRASFDKSGHIGGARIFHRVAEQKAVRIPIQALRALYGLFQCRRPFRFGDNRRHEAHREAFFGGKNPAFHQNRPSLVSADTGREPARAERDAKTPARHAKRRAGHSNTLAAGAEKIGACAHHAAMGERERREWRVRDTLQQPLDPQQLVDKVGIALLVEIAEIEAGAEMLAFTGEDHEPYLLGFGVIERRKQRLDQRVAQCIGARRTCQFQLENGALPFNLQLFRRLHSAHSAAAALPLRPSSHRISSLCSPSAGGRRRTGMICLSIRIGEITVRVRVPDGRSIS
jgi:hypothetical protein